MADMTMAEAAELVRGLARQRVREARAFAKLDAALAMATTLESAIARLTKSRNELAAEVLDLTTRRSGMETALADLNARHLATTHDLDIKTSAYSAELAARIKTEEDTLAALYAKIAAESEAGEQAKRSLVSDREILLDRIEVKHRVSLAEIRRQSDEAQANLKATQDRFAQLVKDATQTAGVS